MELLATTFVTADYFQDVGYIGLRLQKCRQHLTEKPPLDNCAAVTNLGLIRVAGLETFAVGRINVTHEDSGDINRIFLHVVEGTDGIEEGGVIHLSAKPDVSALVINIALPDVLKNRVWFHRAARNQLRE